MKRLSHMWNSARKLKLRGPLQGNGCALKKKKNHSFSADVEMIETTRFVATANKRLAFSISLANLRKNHT